MSSSRLARLVRDVIGYTDDGFVIELKAGLTVLIIDDATSDMLSLATIMAKGKVVNRVPLLALENVR